MFVKEERKVKFALSAKILQITHLLDHPLHGPVVHVSNTINDNRVVSKSCKINPFKTRFECITYKVAIVLKGLIFKTDTS